MPQTPLVEFVPFHPQNAINVNPLMHFTLADAESEKCKKKKKDVLTAFHISLLFSVFNRIKFILGFRHLNTLQLSKEKCINYNLVC